MTTATVRQPETLLLKRRQHIAKDDRFWRIREGLVRGLTWDEEGDAIALGIWGPGDIISAGLSSLNPFELETLSATVLEAVDPDDLERSVVLAQHFQAAEQLLSITRTRLAELRFSRLLEWLGSRFGVRTEQGYQVDLDRIYLTHQTLGELTGSTRVTITRLLNAFERQGAISYEQSRRLRINIRQLPHYPVRASLSAVVR